MKLRLTLAASATLFLAAPAHANLVANGNFASNCAPNAGFCTYYAGDSTDIYHWTVTQGSVDLVTNYWQAPPGGGNSIDLDGLYQAGALSASTSFATVAGEFYRLTFEMSGNPDGGPMTKLLQVIADSTSQNFSYTLTAGNSHSNMLYAPETMVFEATSSLSTLTFKSQDALDNAFGPVIGNVDVQFVPEPMSLSLLGSGLLAAGWFGRRKKRAG